MIKTLTSLPLTNKILNKDFIVCKNKRRMNLTRREHKPQWNN